MMGADASVGSSPAIGSNIRRVNQPGAGLALKAMGAADTRLEFDSAIPPPRLSVNYFGFSCFRKSRWWSGFLAPSLSKLKMDWSERKIIRAWSMGSGDALQATRQRVRFPPGPPSFTVQE